MGLFHKLDMSVKERVRNARLQQNLWAETCWLYHSVFAREYCYIPSGGVKLEESS